jgi:hypothetical protein
VPRRSKLTSRLATPTVNLISKAKISSRVHCVQIWLGEHPAVNIKKSNEVNGKKPQYRNSVIQHAVYWDTMQLMIGELQLFAKQGWLL